MTNHKTKVYKKNKRFEGQVVELIHSICLRAYSNKNCYKLKVYHKTKRPNFLSFNSLISFIRCTGAFLFSRLARLHFTTGSTKAIISHSELLRFILSRSARYCVSTPIGVEASFAKLYHRFHLGLLSRSARYCVSYSTPIGIEAIYLRGNKVSGKIEMRPVVLND
jgi:hypothetical protein